MRDRFVLVAAVLMTFGVIGPAFADPALDALNAAVQLQQQQAIQQQQQTALQLQSQQQKFQQQQTIANYGL